jgi:hypothetical protein
MRRYFVTLLLLLPVSTFAESRLPFMQDRVGDIELPLPFGIGIDFYTMDQVYDIDYLNFDLPGISLDDPGLLDVTNDVQHYDLKVDAWILPFLNVFGIVGHLQSTTVIDLTRAPVQGLPFPLKELKVDSDGTVLGLGFTLAYGTENWFTTVTTTVTDTDLGGDFESSVKSVTVQPRIGLVRNDWQFWVGGLYLDTEEKHSGIFELPVLGDIDFDVVLGGADDWNTAIGVRHVFSKRASLSFEVGFGDREHTLLNYNYRF